MDIKRRPFGAAELRTGGHIVVAVLICAVRSYEKPAAITLFLHLFEVARYGCFRGVTVQPPPITSQARWGGRVFKSASQRILCRGITPSISDLPDISGHYGESDDEQLYPSPSIFHRHLDTIETGTALADTHRF